MAKASKNRAAAITIMALICTAIIALTAASSTQASENIQNDFLALVNAERTSLGKNPLVANAQLENAAYLHSKDMGDNNYFSHTSQDGTQFSQRIAAQGYKYVAAAENIAKAYGAMDAEKVYDMWKNSPGHYANMIGDYVDAGLGIYSIDGYTYYTLDLGKSRNPTSTLTPKPTVSPTPTQNPTATPEPPATPAATSLDSPTPSSTSQGGISDHPTSAPAVPELSAPALSSLMLLMLSAATAIKHRNHHINT
jgi:uncharacterized protein YkwD